MTQPNSFQHMRTHINSTKQDRLINAIKEIPQNPANVQQHQLIKKSLFLGFQLNWIALCNLRSEQGQDAQPQRCRDERRAAKIKCNNCIDIDFN